MILILILILILIFTRHSINDTLAWKEDREKLSDYGELKV
jgi:TRAP-type C4-dicarboxylate transport system permease small subunit